SGMWINPRPRRKRRAQRIGRRTGGVSLWRIGKSNLHLMCGAARFDEAGIPPPEGGGGCQDEMNVMPMVKAAKRKRLAEKGITHNGVTRSAQEWSLMLGGNPGLVRKRLRYGWPIKDAVTRPPMRRGHKARKTHSNYQSQHTHPRRQ